MFPTHVGVNRSGRIHTTIRIQPYPVPRAHVELDIVLRAVILPR